MYNPEGIRKHYNDYGLKEWERLQRSLHGVVEYENTMSVLRRYLPSSGHLLDAGGGPGRYTISLASEGHSMTLVDISDEQLSIAREKIREVGMLDRVQAVRRMDICDLHEFSNSSFDGVLCLGGALSYVREGADQAIRELVRVAKPGAPIIVSVMSLLGTYHLISAFDAEGFLRNIRDHVEWDPATPFPEVLNSRVGSPEWHAPMTLYTSVGLRELLQRNGCTVVEVASTNTITSSYWKGLDKIDASPEARDMLIRLEREFCNKPGLVDMGEHLVAVARA